MCLFQTCCGKVYFSSLEKTLVVNASPKHGDVLKAGENNITVTWGLNQSFPASTAATFKTVKAKLCFAPISQKDRAWRKTKDELEKDKTCEFKIVEKAYDSSVKEQSYEWVVERDVPTAIYFIRVYVFGSEGHEVGYGQTTDAKKTTNLFEIKSITGRHASIDIAAGVFSGFSVLSLLAFFYAEKRKGKKPQ